MEEFEFKSIFSATATVIEPSEEDVQETLAAKKDLSGLLPEGIRPENDPDLLYIVADLAVAGMVNANDDCLLPEDAVEIYKNFEKKQCNIEHNRGDVCGYILRAFLTDRETGKVLAPDEALASGKPFNITTVAVIWKVVNKELCDFIVSASDPSSPDYKKLSLSFEMGFTSFSVVLSKDAVAIGAQIIKKDDESFGAVSKKLKIMGGTGKDGEYLVSRALAGKIIPLGQGIVGNPAAQVEGIQALLKAEEPEDKEENEEEEEKLEDDEIEDDELEEEMSEEDIQKFMIQMLLKYIDSAKINNKREENSVSPSIEFSKTMQISNIKQLEEKWNELVKSETALASVRTLLADEIAKESEKYLKEVEAEKQKVAEANAEKERVAKAHADLSKQLEDIKAELDALKSAQAAAEAEQKYNERMAFINSEFDLSDEERPLITEEIRDLDDEAFAKWQKKAKIFMKEKTKAFKVQKKKEMEESLCKAGVTVVVDEKTLDLKEIVASAKPIEPTLPNSVALSSKDLKEMVAKAFSKENMTKATK